MVNSGNFFYEGAMKTIISRGSFGAVVLAYGLTFGEPSQATLLLQSGLVGGSGDVDNVVFAPCGLDGITGLTVQGCLNSSHSTLVNFTGQENLTTDEGGGQARIVGADGAFDYVKIQLDDPSLGFSKLQFNLDAAADGTATFQGVDQFGAIFDFGPLALSGTGENFFTLYSNDDQVAVSFTLLSTVDIQNISDLQQVRLGPTDLTTVVPEPATLAVLGVGLLGLGFLARRRGKV